MKSRVERKRGPILTLIVALGQEREVVPTYFMRPRPHTSSVLLFFERGSYEAELINHQLP